jgi:isopenicillin N synthase-like dioxygenase
MKDLFTPIPYSLWRSDKGAFAREFGDSLANTGFAVLAGHGMNEDVLERGLEAARDFFALPEETKRAYFIASGAGQRGYTPFGREIAKDAAANDLKEFWHVGRNLPPEHPHASVMAPNLTVLELPLWAERTNAMFAEFDRLGGDLLAAIALYLGLSERFFDDPVRDGNSILRLLHYPAQTEPPPEGAVRAGAHEDINVITLLLGADEGGLQARHRSGVWLDVNPPRGSLVVNVGDMLQRLTNRHLPSTTHRVVNPRPERSRYPRYSTPFFLHFRPDYVIRTLPGCIGPERPDLYPEPITTQDFLMQRLREIGLLAS